MVIAMSGFEAGLVAHCQQARGFVDLQAQAVAGGVHKGAIQAVASQHLARDAVHGRGGNAGRTVAMAANCASSTAR